MSRWGSVFRIVLAAIPVAMTMGQSPQAWALLASQVESERQRRKRDHARARAHAAYNEAQKDRLEMLDLQPAAARTLVLARFKYVEAPSRAQPPAARPQWVAPEDRRI